MKSTIKITSVDGTVLEGDIRIAPNQRGSVLMNHGITADRHESGLYDDLAERLFANGISSLTFDLRCHGKSGGKQEDLTLSGCINDIMAAGKYLLSSTKTSSFAIVASSFSGGISIAASAQFASEVNTMVLLNPRLDYRPWVTDSPYWSGNGLTDNGRKKIVSNGYLERNGFRVGRHLFNEILCFNPAEKQKTLKHEILFIHGSVDSVVPFASSQKYYNENGHGSLITVEGADHGFTLPDDEAPSHPVNRRFINFVLSSTTSWLNEHF